MAEQLLALNIADGNGQLTKYSFYVGHNYSDEVITALGYTIINPADPATVPQDDGDGQLKSLIASGKLIRFRSRGRGTLAGVTKYKYFNFMTSNAHFQQAKANIKGKVVNGFTIMNAYTPVHIYRR